MIEEMDERFPIFFSFTVEDYAESWVSSHGYSKSQP